MILDYCTAWYDSKRWFRAGWRTSADGPHRGAYVWARTLEEARSIAWSFMGEHPTEVVEIGRTSDEQHNDDNHKRSQANHL